MPGPWQSRLIPYEAEIRRLRAAKPATTYAAIAAILEKEHGLKIGKSAIFGFVKARAKGARVYRLPSSDDGVVEMPTSLRSAAPSPLDLLRPVAEAKDDPFNVTPKKP